MFRLDSKKALVTGGASGIGEAIAQVLSRAGAAVVVADIDAENGERVAQACRADTPGGRFISLNVADEMNCARVADEIGPIDILINNAGIGMSARSSGQRAPISTGSTESMCAASSTSRKRLLAACSPPHRRNCEHRVDRRRPWHR
jgi:NAD(P)-dependent dehydrogenase (short-subunit alcohol dehydrogenase family)